MVPYNFNRIWNVVKRTPLGRFLQFERDLPLAWDMHRATGWSPSLADYLGRSLLMNPLPTLRGAAGGYGDESRRWLQPASDATIATTGANTVNYNVMDWTLITSVGFVWTVAGTVTAMSMNFNLHNQLAGASLLTTRLDATNGFVTAPTVAGQAIANVLYKELDALGPVLVTPGYSVQAIVVTTTTAGNGLPFILAIPKPDTMLNLGTRGIVAT